MVAECKQLDPKQPLERVRFCGDPSLADSGFEPHNDEDKVYVLDLDRILRPD